MKKGIDLLCVLVAFMLVGLLGCTNSSGGDSEGEDPPDLVSDEPVPPLLTSAGDITDFLWKPEADGGYNNGLLVILVDPCEVVVLVNGEELVDFGPGNGRCTTARSLTKSGCGYGTNVQVQVLDSFTRLPYLFPGGLDTYIIPNGCNRTEFKL